MGSMDGYVFTTYVHFNPRNILRNESVRISEKCLYFPTRFALRWRRSCVVEVDPLWETQYMVIHGDVYVLQVIPLSSQEAVHWPNCGTCVGGPHGKLHRVSHSGSAT